jgi:hypothetical protein
MQTLTLEEQQDLLRRQIRGYELVEQQRRRDWASLDYEQNLPMLDSLLSIACEHRQPQLTSGLVAWQRLMARKGNLRE